jgi:hypothetical protein
MRIASILILIVFAACAGAQSSTHSSQAAIERAKKLTVSSLDSRLPKVSLEFFLNYEAEGLPVTWKIVDCVEPNTTSPKDLASASTCVEADFSLKNGTTGTVVVSVGSTEQLQEAQKLVRATITNRGGTPRPVQRLGDLPQELQRPAPKGPRDLQTPIEGL